MSRLIDADALKEFIGKVRAEYNFFTDEERPRYEAHSMALELLNIYLDSAPTIDAVEVVHGEWIYDANGYDYGLPAWKCNQCGCINANIPPRIMTKESKPNYAPVNPNAFSGSNFCPNCGAKMDGERKDESLGKDINVRSKDEPQTERSE